MTGEKQLERPRQVTMAGWVGGVASAMMLASVFTVMPKLRSIDTRQSINEYLTKGAGKALSIDLDQAVLLARIGLFVTAAAAAATLVFTVFVMRRDRQSRVALTVMALPILLCGVFVDPFLAGFILAATVLVWTPPASDWFAGRAPRPVPQSMPPLPPLPPHTPHAERRPTEPPPYGAGYGGSSGAQGPQPSMLTAPAPRPADDAPAQPPRRPAAVGVACAISWVASAGTGLLLAIGVAFAGSNGFRDQLETELAKSGNASRVSIDDLVVGAQVMAVLVVVWCLAACAVAVFAFLGQGWARITLAVSAIIAAVLSVLAVLSFPGFLVLTLAATAVAVLLFRPATARWYDAVRHRSQPPPPVQPPSGTW